MKVIEDLPLLKTHLAIFFQSIVFFSTFSCLNLVAIEPAQLLQIVRSGEVILEAAQAGCIEARGRAPPSEAVVQLSQAELSWLHEESQREKILRLNCKFWKYPKGLNGIYMNFVSLVVKTRYDRGIVFVLRK